MSELNLIFSHSATLSNPKSIGYGERHRWEATITWEGERPDLNTAKVKVRLDGFTLFNDSLLNWNRTSALIEETVKACFEEK